MIKCISVGCSAFIAGLLLMWCFDSYRANLAKTDEEIKALHEEVNFLGKNVMGMQRALSGGGSKMGILP